MGLADINEAIDRMGGTWVKLENVGDKFEGVLIDIDIVDRTTPEGDVVYYKGTTDPRKVWIVSFRADPESPEDDGIRKFSGNENAQRAIGAARSEYGRNLVEGDIIKLGVTEVPEAGKFEQKTYKAAFAKGIATPEPPAVAPAEANAEAVDLGF